MIFRRNKLFWSRGILFDPPTFEKKNLKIEIAIHISTREIHRNLFFIKFHEFMFQMRAFKAEIRKVFLINHNIIDY